MSHPNVRDDSHDLTFFMDSGAGQCMTSCSEAFQTIQACAVLIVGVGGSMPAHGMGTACFIGMAEGLEYVICRESREASVQLQDATGTGSDQRLVVLTRSQQNQ